MNIKKLIKGLLVILGNYQRLVKNFLYFLIFTVIITGISLVITLPLWYAATKHSKGYTITVILLLIILTGIYLVQHLKKWVVSKQKSGISPTGIILIPLRKIAVFTFYILSLYGIIFIFSRGFLLIAISLSAAYLLMLGYYIFIHSKNNKNNANNYI